MQSFRPSEIVFTYLLDIGSGKGDGTATGVKTAIRCKQGHAACKILSLQQILFHVTVEFHAITMLSQK